MRLLLSRSPPPSSHAVRSHGFLATSELALHGLRGRAKPQDQEWVEMEDWHLLIICGSLFPTKWKFRESEQAPNFGSMREREAHGIGMRTLQSPYLRTANS